MEVEIVKIVSENTDLCGIKNSLPHTQQSTMATEITSPSTLLGEVSKVTPLENMTAGSAEDGAAHSGISKSAEIKEMGNVKNKRKRRRGKPKSKNCKPYKKTNWKFQMPQRYRNNIAANGGVRSKLVRSRSIVPYNTNKFLMEEHLAEVPTALLTPSGRTRDSSFSVDSEDNYFYSLPEDEEEFLTKEFANVYERARVERLENMTKQQLIEECLQIEDRYSQNVGNQQQQQSMQNISAEFLNKIRFLEEKIREINKENNELRRKLDFVQNKNLLQPEPMCSSSEDSESDSSSSSSGSPSCLSSEYNSGSPQNLENSNGNDASNMQLEDLTTYEAQKNGPNCNNPIDPMCNGYHNTDSSNSNPTSPAARNELQ